MLKYKFIMGEKKNKMSANNMKVSLQLARTKIILQKIMTFSKKGSKDAGFKWRWKRS